jgi:hypothetical protein
MVCPISAQKVQLRIFKHQKYVFSSDQKKTSIVRQISSHHLSTIYRILHLDMSMLSQNEAQFNKGTFYILSANLVAI